MKNIFILGSLFFLISCAKEKKNDVGESIGPSPECMSFLGKPLFAKPADSTATVKSDSAIAAITSKSTLSEEDYIEIGRRLIAVNQFNMAISNYSEGLGKYPASFKLLRHRGHRYLNVRQPDNAIEDLMKAEALIRSQPEVFETDASGKPGATYQHQIWYHIGIYHFLKADYKKCAEAFEKSLATAHAGNDVAGASDWLYNACQRDNAPDKKEKLERILKPFSLDFEIDPKDYPYFRRLLLYKGVITPEQLIDKKKTIDQMSLLEVTKLYGLANWYRYSGNLSKADSLCHEIVKTREWPAFAVASAEKDLQ